MDMKTHSEYMQAIEHFRDVLVAEQDKRGERSRWVDTEDGQALEWMIAERVAAFDALSRYRALRDRPAPLMADVARAESSAAGHSDYTSKFAMRLADLAIKVA